MIVHSFIHSRPIDDTKLTPSGGIRSNRNVTFRFDLVQNNSIIEETHISVKQDAGSYDSNTTT